MSNNSPESETCRQRPLDLTVHILVTVKNVFTILTLVKNKGEKNAYITEKSIIPVEFI